VNRHLQLRQSRNQFPNYPRNALPLNGRRYTGLVLLTAAGSTKSQKIQATFFFNGRFSIGLPGCVCLVLLLRSRYCHYLQVGLSG
jgi:hypothetical protein